MFDNKIGPTPLLKPFEIKDIEHIEIVMPFSDEEDHNDIEKPSRFDNWKSRSYKKSVVSMIALVAIATLFITLLLQYNLPSLDS